MDALVKGITRGEPLLVVGLVDTAAVERAKSVHDTFPTASAALGRLMSGALLLSSFLKDGQKVILQASGDGPLHGIVAEADSAGSVRGYVKKPHVHLGLKDGKLDVGRGVGKGYLNVIKDLGLREYYRGTVPLRTGEIATDLAYYLNASEQLPAAVSLGVYVDVDNSVKASGGFLVHPLPGADEGAIARLEGRLGKIRPVSAMILEGMGPREIMEEAAGLPVDVLEDKEVRFRCPCTKDRVLDAIAALGKSEIDELIGKGEAAKVECRFCRTEYTVSVKELSSLLTDLG
ncbi:MAG: Hsp33 family molecular chaperone HslO [Deltaproteobacteria bacterium]|nr:Hsp33 family molecular chaperone HslO [Deltaproteobacteria bacterium]